jgi:hypothetical protein
MQTDTHQPGLTPLSRETRAALPTHEAAAHLTLKPQTLRCWAMREDGPLRPIRINGRLAWPVSELRRVLGVPE